MNEKSKLNLTRGRHTFEYSYIWSTTVWIFNVLSFWFQQLEHSKNSNVSGPLRAPMIGTRKNSFFCHNVPATEGMVDEEGSEGKDKGRGGSGGRSVSREGVQEGRSRLGSDYVGIWERMKRRSKGEQSLEQWNSGNMVAQEEEENGRGC